MKGYTIVEKHESMLGRYATVEVNGLRFFAAVERGKMVRIPFKPRGQNRGWRYNGYIRDATGHEVWSGPVGGSIGVRGLLRYAGLLPNACASE